MLRKIAHRLISRKKTDPELTSISDSCSTPLQNLLDQKARILVKVEGEREIFQSMLLSIDKLNEVLILDELFPLPEKNITYGTPIYIEHHAQGKTTTFSSVFISTTRDHGLPALLINMPEYVDQDQRRNAFRLSLSPENIVSAQLSQNAHENYFGVVKDISNHGLRINLSGNQLEQLSNGAILPSCIIKLDEMNQLECQLTVRSKRYFNRPYRHTQIGTEITHIGLSHRNLLTNFVSRQQRLQCRHKAAQL